MDNPSMTSFNVANTMDHEIREMFNQMRVDGELCDVTLVVDSSGQSGTEQLDASTPGIAAHRCVLAAASPFFKAMFTNEFKERDQQVLRLQQVDMATLRTIVNFVYTGLVNIDVDNVQTLLDTSTVYQMSQLQELCIRFMVGQLNVDNCLDVYRLAKLHSCPKLKRESLDLIRNNFEEISRSSALMAYSYCDFVELIGDDHLKVSSEETIFVTVTNWLGYDWEPRMNLRETLFKLVRLDLLSLKFFRESVIDNKFFASSSEYQNLIHEEMKNRLSDCGSLSISSRSKSRPAGLLSSRILVVGGYHLVRYSLCDINSCELFDSVANQWHQIKSMREPRSQHCVLSLNNLVFALGGKSRCGRCEYFNPEANSWGDIAPMLQPRFSFGACALNGRIYAVGGLETANSMESYDFHSERWHSGPGISQEKSNCAFVTAENTLFAIGSSSVEQLDPRQGTWTKLSPMIVQRIGHAAVAYDGQLYVTGGSEMRFCEVYDIRTDRWRSFERMSISRTNHCMVELGGKLHVLGVSKDVEIYDPAINRWTPGTPMRDSRFLSGAAILEIDRLEDIIINQ